MTNLQKFAPFNYPAKLAIYPDIYYRKMNLLFFVFNNFFRNIVTIFSKANVVTTVYYAAF